MMTAAGSHRSVPLSAVCLVLAAFPLGAHDLTGHSGPTYEITAPIQLAAKAARLRLTILDRQTGTHTAARFSLVLDGKPYTPEGLGPHGLRFVSIHQGKKQFFTTTYSRGTGPVEVPLPDGTRRGVVTVVKGFDYLTEEIPFQLRDGVADATVILQRWNKLREKGWFAAEEHLHYDRTDPEHDADWLTLLAGDDLAYGHFLVLKGGNLPGVWAQQYAYGKKGEASDGQRLIRPGEEYRDQSQGHINLLGVSEVILPIMAGTSDHPYNYPPLHDVLLHGRSVGGFVGPAHGTDQGRSPTGVLDAVLGAVDFFEIANTFLYKTDVWYRLMNCGYILPPAAGTDLPNYPFRDPWQPLLGDVRMYARVGETRDFESWKAVVRRGEVFISGGPMIEFTANGVGPGGTVRLPAAGGDVALEAELADQRPLETLEIVQNGEVIPTEIRRETNGRIHRWRVRQTFRMRASSWLAARGVGVAKQALEAHHQIKLGTVAHTAAIRVMVGEQPIASAKDAAFLVRSLTEQRRYFETKAKYEREEHRAHVLGLFDRAIEMLGEQTKATAPSKGR